MSEHCHWLVPLPDAQPEAEIFVVYESTQEFYSEVRYREEWGQYCQWYQDVAQRHRQELKTMQKDPNLLGWFNRIFHAN